MPRLALNLLLLVLALCAGLVYASPNQSVRNNIALNVFPKIIAVDLGLREKLNTRHNATLLFVYKDDPLVANIILNSAQRKISNINGYTVELRAVSSRELANYSDRPAGVFICEQFDDEQFALLTSYSRTRQAILFSPFDGDVERGASAGLWVGARVQPYLNLTSLADSGIKLHPTLLRVSKKYE